MRSWITRYQRRALLVMAAVAVTVGVIDCGGSNAPGQKSNGVTKVTVTPAAASLDTPIDATPDPNGVTIYFIAKSEGTPAIFSVPADGGAVTTLYAGAPLVAPRGISVSSDGKTIYIADPQSGTDGKGAILSMPASGDTPVPIAATAGTQPSALDASEENGSDDLYYTGTDTSGQPAVFLLPSGASSITTLLKGAPLVKPDGIAVATDLSVYVSDAQAGTKLPGQVFKITSGTASKIGPELEPGSPAGIVVTLDDAKLLVSSVDASAGTSQVDIIQTKDGTMTVFNDVIKANNVSGGVHRARFKETYAWAGKTSVYTIRIKTILADSSTPGGVG